MPGVETTSVAREAGRDVSLDDIKPLVRSALEKAYGLQFVEETPS
jgi:hypothetical protein